jgi:uncharacterized membrane protein HdeD (DUF308 family)
MDATTARRPAAGRVAGHEQAEQVWWAFVVLGFLWLVFALLVFRVDATSVHGIAILTGIVCVAGAGLEFLTAAAASGWWRALRIVLGVAFLVIGGLAFAHPGNTFKALAAIFAFYLLFAGVFNIVFSLFDRARELWWAQLIVGVVEVLLAFWAAGNFGHKAFLLIVWVGASALAAGITQIVFGFQLRSEGKQTAAA